eukprot:Pompholyxophrys_sp_v1_NODE_1_length_32789_cov_6.460653.p35 type:complete len:106 gc:universal NODE_1_length_32789_cov_6.460653:27670-27987(+)
MALHQSCYWFVKLIKLNLFASVGSIFVVAFHTKQLRDYNTGDKDILVSITIVIRINTFCPSKLWTFVTVTKGLQNDIRHCRDFIHSFDNRVEESIFSIIGWTLLS